MSTENLPSQKGEMRAQRLLKIKTGRTFLAASTGGHLEQLYRFVESGAIETEEREWLTFAHSQTESLLASEVVTLTDYIPSRGLIRAIRSLPVIFTAMNRFKPETVVSTGAAVAIPTAIASLLLGRRMIYIESVSRFHGPSLTGKILAGFPWVRCFTQHERWVSRRWRLGPTVLSEHVALSIAAPKVTKVFISLGTIKPYRFDRAVEALRATIPRDVQVRLQYGCTDGHYDGWESSETITAEEFSNNIRWADIVILHAGVGSALNILDCGKFPVLLVRRKTYAEHVDDHQEQIAQALEDQGLCMVADLENMDWESLVRESAYTVQRRTTLPDDSDRVDVE